MTAKIHILPKWAPLAKLHAGWHFEGHYRVPESVIQWVDGGEWPETLPLVVDIDDAARGRLKVTLQISAQAELPCQRCGEPVEWRQEWEQQLLLVSAEDAQETLAQWVVDEDRVDWEALVAQEISLALPDFPRHAECDLHPRDEKH